LRDIGRSASARSLPTGRGLIGAAVASAVTATAFALATAVPAMAAAAPPTITSAFTPTEIGVGDSTATALSFTITNPNASGTLSGVSFTDALPAGLTVDNPNGENGTCGSASVVTAVPASATISLTGGSLKATASCTVSVSLIAGQVGVLQNTTGPVSSSAGSSATGDTQSLTVLPPPTVTVRGVKTNAHYTFGAKVKPTFTCAQPGDPAVLADCSAVDDLGNSVASGKALRTTQAGSHSLTVTATSSDGLSTTDTFDYTVLSNNRFTVSAIKHNSAGTISLRLGLPGAGKVKVVELAAHGVTFGRYAVSVSAERTLHVKVKPTPAGKALLKKGTTAKIKLEVTYTPKGGVDRTLTKRAIALTTK
jgi:hypothetical protein